MGRKEKNMRTSERIYSRIIYIFEHSQNVFKHWLALDQDMVLVISHICISQGEELHHCDKPGLMEGNMEVEEGSRQTNN